MASTITVDKIKGGTSGVALTLPTTDGSAGQLLKTDGSAVLSWATDAGGIASLAADTTPQLGGDLDCNGAQIQWSKGADVVSATALPVLTDGNYFDVTGTTAVTSINTTGGAGTLIKLHFDAILTLTHHATDLILPGGANITTAAGDEAEFIEYAAGDYRCTSYSKASGEPVVSAGGGKVLQVISTTKTDTFTSTSAGATITGLTAVIEPSLTTSKILVIANVFFQAEYNNRGAITLQRGGSDLAVGDAAGSRSRVSAASMVHVDSQFLPPVSISYLDAPVSTASLTYSILGRAESASYSWAVNRSILDSNGSTYYRGISTITVMEIGA
jgi:hypothetical protein